ncbi:amidohydrolase [Alteribacillus persepolensis]|nr:amidohydrolase [Alteribacillus persepolensis]
MDNTKLNQEVKEMQQQVVDWRRHFHRYPELSFQEEETSQYIYDTLQSFGNLEVSRPTPTSVMARLIGKEDGKTLAIRADIDALPIAEESTFDYASEREGVMHACGHDGHAAMLLGTAKILSRYQEEINGEVRFLFEHAEEAFPGGGKEMVEAGAMEGVDYVIGAHVASTIDVGQTAVTYGPMTAAADGFWVTIQGKGGHGALPHDTVDSIAVGAQVVSNLQQIVSRNIDPIDSAVLTIGEFHAGEAGNIVADSVKFSGIVRTFDPKYRKQIEQLMHRVIKGVTEAHGAAYTMEYKNGYASIQNDEYVTKVVEDTITELYGEDTIIHEKPQMIAEDFSAFSNEAPGTYFKVGARNEEKGIVYPHHHPKFTFDEQALEHGMKIFVNAVHKFLNES